VRADLGYPPLVTPTSQIVGTQAVLNVLADERYKTITTEVKRYLQGHYGAAPGTVNEELRRRAIGGEEVITSRPADLLSDELDTLRGEIGDLAQGEEDVLTYAMFPDLGKTFLTQRRDGTLEAEALLPPQSGGGDGSGSPAVATEFVIDVHGESYRVAVTGTGQKSSGKRNFYLTLDGVPEEVVVEPLNSYVASQGGNRPAISAEGDVGTTMPGNIVDVLVAEGDTVEAGQAVLIIEAMKMETELQAPIGGTVAAVNAAKGDRVTPGEALIQIQR
jgi:pyruvate carboxylase subunit B